MKRTGIKLVYSKKIDYVCEFNLFFREHNITIKGKALHICFWTMQFIIVTLAFIGFFYDCYYLWLFTIVIIWVYDSYY